MICCGACAFTPGSCILPEPIEVRRHYGPFERPVRSITSDGVPIQQLLKLSFVVLLAFNGLGCSAVSSYLAGLSAEATAATGENLGATVRAYLAEREATPDTAEVYLPYIALLPFLDDSGFLHEWDLEDEMAGLLTVEMGKKSNWRMVPYTVVLDAMATLPSRERRDNDEASEVGEVLKADFVGRGTVLDYNFERLQIGEAMIGGYKSFKGTAEMQVTLVRVRDRTSLEPVRVLREILDRGLGIDLLGRPRKQDLQFAGLRSMDFGSEDFLATAIGQATVEAMAALVDGLDLEIRPSGVNLDGTIARILSVQEEEIFINIGSKNGVHIGYRFRVLPARARALDNALDPAASIATLEVIDIIGGRLSRVSRISETVDIAAGDRLQYIEP